MYIARILQKYTDKHKDTVINDLHKLSYVFNRIISFSSKIKCI